MVKSLGRAVTQQLTTVVIGMPVKAVVLYFYMHILFSSLYVSYVT
jgi:hypothetical protein